MKWPEPATAATMASGRSCMRRSRSAGIMAWMKSSGQCSTWLASWSPPPFRTRLLPTAVEVSLPSHGRDTAGSSRSYVPGEHVVHLPKLYGRAERDDLCARDNERQVTRGRVVDVVRFERFVVIPVAQGEAPAHYEAPVWARAAVVRQPLEGWRSVPVLAKRLERHGEVAQLNRFEEVPRGVDASGCGVLSGSRHELPPQRDDAVRCDERMTARYRRPLRVSDHPRLPVSPHRG